MSKPARMANDATETRVLNIAHRGARAFAPENTLEAFAKAKTFGCEMIELDVHLSKDNEIIVHHDDQLTRCSDVEVKFPGRASYFISDFDLEEIKQLDAGSWFARELNLPAQHRQGFLQSLTPEESAHYISPEELAHYASGKVAVPTLGQVLELSRALGLRVNIELKMLPRMYPGLTDAVIDLIEAMAMQADVLISSFDHAQLPRVRERAPTIATAVLTNERLALPAEYLQRIGADALHPGTEPLGLQALTPAIDADAIAAVRESGKGLNVWTCNEKDAMRRLIAAGVSGLISDYPNRVREVIGERASNLKHSSI